MVADGKNWPRPDYSYWKGEHRKMDWALSPVIASGRGLCLRQHLTADLCLVLACSVVAERAAADQCAVAEDKGGVLD